MLCVRIEGREVEVTPAALAALVFDGKVDREHAARLGDETTERSLEQSLGSGYCEALTGELHRRIRLVCSADSSAVDLQELCTRVERLCAWRWPSSPATARFFWAAAWLNELTGRTRSAIDFYDTFLLLPAGESHLRLLALNNRGVLQIQLGRLNGVEDMARAVVGEDEAVGIRHAAIGEEADTGAPGSPTTGYRLPTPHYPSRAGLPVACFNLLNLINVAYGSAELLRTVDEELTDFFSRLGPELWSWWLGTEDGGRKTEDRGPRTEEGGQSCDPSHLPASVLRPLAWVLRDPTYRRLNTLVARLSAAARGLTADLHHPMERPSAVFRRLSLWDCRLPQESSTPSSPLSADGQRPTTGGELSYAEAGALLLNDDIPTCLTKQDHPLGRLETSLREEWRGIDSHVAAGQYELARARLLVQRRVLESLEDRPGLATLLGHVDAQVERIQALEAQAEHLRLQETCGRFVAEVEELCARTEACPAQSAWADLQRRLQQFRARLAPETNREAIGLLDELAARAAQHVQKLRWDQIEKTIRDSLLHVRQSRPSDWTIPVPESAYRALEQCRLHDPESRIEDWAALQEQLDGHQGQHYTLKALSALQSGVRWDRIEGDLVQALVHRPDQWLTLAPLFGWQAEEGGPKTEDGGRKAGERRTPTSPLSTPERAGRLLERAFEQIGADVQKCLRLWQCVELTLAPVLAGREVQAFDEARKVAEKCLNHWPARLPQTPARADPRHPVNRFLEACEKARRLVEAEQLLGARPPRLDEARQRFVGILQSGVNAREQLRRIVTGLYLAQFHEKDPPPVQRQVLADLEAWVAKVPPESVPQIQGQEIVAETEKVRHELIKEN